MSIKNMLISLVAGAVVLGVGLGITALEISRWDTAQYPAYLDKEPVKTWEMTNETDVSEFESINVYISGMPNSFRSEKLIEIVEDKNCKDNFVVKIDYKGKEPFTDVYDFEDTNEKGEKFRRMDVHIWPDYNYTLREIRQLADRMFESKVFYTGNTATVIEKVTVYTATPDRFKVNR